MRWIVDWPERISADHDTVDRFLYAGISVESPSSGDIATAIEWLALYGAETEADAQPYANVIGHLERTLQRRETKAAKARFKRRLRRTIAGQVQR